MSEFNYPEPHDADIRNKVEFRIYLNHEDALAAAEIAKRHAVHMVNQGYDFGYICPGTIKKHDDEYWVCCP